MRVLDLFSGIGGFSLGLERAGMKTVAFCEIEPFCRRVLAKHWPEVPCYDDVRTLAADRLRDDGIAVDVICGGFPCQDISVAGKGAGLAGARSGLWSEYARLVRELRPRYVIVENVAALLSRGLGDVLGDLAALGYDAEWHCIPASAVGAPHRRDRIWIVAYTHNSGYRQDVQSVGQSRSGAPADAGGDGEVRYVADTHGGGRREQGDECQEIGNTEAGQSRDRSPISLAGGEGLAVGPGTLGEWAYAATTGNGWWAIEPDVGRVVDGPADKLDRRRRLIALGNAVVPQIPELIGRAILGAERALVQRQEPVDEATLLRPAALPPTGARPLRCVQRDAQIPGGTTQCEPAFQSVGQAS